MHVAAAAMALPHTAAGTASQLPSAALRNHPNRRVAAHPARLPAGGAAATWLLAHWQLLGCSSCQCCHCCCVRMRGGVPPTAAATLPRTARHVQRIWRGSVDDDVAACHRLVKRSWRQQVGLEQLEALRGARHGQQVANCRLAVWVAACRVHGVPGCQEAQDDPASDVAGRASHADAQRLRALLLR